MRSYLIHEFYKQHSASDICICVISMRARDVTTCEVSTRSRPPTGPMRRGWVSPPSPLQSSRYLLVGKFNHFRWRSRQIAKKVLVGKSVLRTMNIYPTLYILVLSWTFCRYDRKCQYFSSYNFFFLLHLEKEDMLRKIKSDKQKTKGISY